MKTLSRSIIWVIIILMTASCRPGTEPLELNEVEVREIESFSKKVRRPNFTDLLYAGGKFSTQWDLGFRGGFVNLYLYKGGTYIYTIIRSTTNDHCFKWRIPDDLPAGSNYKLKVENASDLTNYGFSTHFTVNRK